MVGEFGREVINKSYNPLHLHGSQLGGLYSRRFVSPCDHGPSTIGMTNPRAPSHNIPTTPIVDVTSFKSKLKSKVAVSSSMKPRL